MNLSPVLFFHICAGTSGLFSGAAALSFRKGSRWHVLAGRVFVGSMLAMAAGAVYLAIVKHQPNNIGGGIFTFYLILTAWLTARRRNEQIRLGCISDSLGAWDSHLVLRSGKDAHRGTA